jgi:hypothetical protein
MGGIHLQVCVVDEVAQLAVDVGAPGDTEWVTWYVVCVCVCVCVCV